MPTVKESIQGNISLWKKYYEQALSAAVILEKFPFNISGLRGEFDHGFEETYILKLIGDEAFEIAYDWGVIFEEKFVFTGGSNSMVDIEKSTDFTAHGKLSPQVVRSLGLGDVVIVVRVSKLSKPETCTIEAVTRIVLETKYVTKCIDDEIGS